ncbi:MAG: AI-2E family transporter [Lachnospiraceae bacterium]|nr:AI-2E family transporter [Lachnospiraceae bacterium]
MKEKYSNHFRWAITTICTVTICLIVFFLLFRSNELGAFFKKLSSVLLPVIIGAIIAYLINPIVNFLDKLLTKLFLSVKFTAGKAQGLALWFSIFLSMAIFLFFVYFLISLILPELYQNIKNFVSNFEGYVTTITTWFSELEILQDNPALYNNLSSTLNKMLASIEDWLSTSLLTSLSGILSGFAFRIIGIFNLILDIVVGLIVSIYILSSKKKYTAKAKRFAYVAFKPQTANTVLKMASRCNKIFSGFISGKLLDSLIIGIICFIGLSIFNTPYTLLVSVIVGVTNIIPFFGPFIGAIPSAVLILLADPTNLKPMIVFVIFIICLQQFDGNILGPKILGDSTGISPLMVVVSITIGGGFFGFMGMFLGVPTFAVISYLFRCFIHYRLKKKGLPPGHKNYIDLTSIDYTAGELHYCTPAASSLSGKPELYTKQFKVTVPEDTTFSQTVHEAELELQSKPILQTNKGSRPKKKSKQNGQKEPVQNASDHDITT